VSSFIHSKDKIAESQKFKIAWPRHRSGQFVIRKVVFAVFNLTNKVEGSISSRYMYYDRKGDAKCRKWNDYYVAVAH